MIQPRFALVFALAVLTFALGAPCQKAHAQCTGCPTYNPEGFAAHLSCHNDIPNVSFFWVADCSVGTNYDIYWSLPGTPWYLLKDNAGDLGVYDAPALADWSDRTVIFRLDAAVPGCATRSVERVTNFPAFPTQIAVTAQLLDGGLIKIDWSPDAPTPPEHQAYIYRDQEADPIAIRPWSDGSFNFTETICGTHTYRAVFYLDNDDDDLYCPKATSDPVSFNSIPTLRSPPNGELSAACAVELDWDPSCGAHYYIVQGSKNPNFIGTISFSVNVPEPSSSVMIGLATEPGVDHYWRVQACNSSNACSEWSTVWTYSRPRILGPGPLSASDENVGTGVALTWTNVSGELGYKVYRDNVHVKTLPANVSTWVDLEPNEGDYFYCVTSIDPCGSYESQSACDMGHMPYDPRSKWASSTNRGSAAADHAAAFDPMRNRMAVFGGRSSPSNVTDESWTYSLPPFTESWTPWPLRPNVPSGRVPSPRSGAGMAYDPQGDYFYVYGGSGSGMNGSFWILYPYTTYPESEDPSWHEVTTDAGTRPTGSTRLTFDSRRGRLIVTSPVQGVFAFASSSEVDDWSTIWSGSMAPYAGQEGSHVAYDPVNDRLLVYGGWKLASPRTVANEYAYATVYALPLANPASGWVAVATGGPGALADGSFVYDSEGQRMLFYGGERGFRTTGSPATINANVWALSLIGSTSWTQLSLAGGQTPAARFRHSAVFGNDLMVIFGGTTDGTNILNDTWYLKAPDTTPPAAITGFYVDNVSSTSASVVWPAPGDDGNMGQASAYDIRYSEVAITGDSGFNHASLFRDVPTPAPPGTNQGAVVTTLRKCTRYWFAMKTVDEEGNWSAMSNVVTVKTPGIGPGCTPGEFSAQAETEERILSLTVPQVSRSHAVIQFTLDGGADDARYDLAVYDVTGRLCRRLDASVGVEGPGQIAWDLRDDHGISLGSGIYFVRLKGLSGVITRRFVVFR